MKLPCFNTFKKPISLLLSLAMLFALMPTFAIGAGADESLSGTMIVYDFRYKAYPGESASLMADTVFSDYTQIRPWAYIGDKNLGSAASNNTVYCQFVCWSIPSGQNAWAAFKIDVPAAGRYNANLGYYRYNNGGIFGVYIVPYTPEAAANIDEYLVPENKKAQVDSYYSGTAGTTEIALPDISFEEDGDYILIFRAEGKQQASGGCNTLISTLTLAGMEYSGYNHEITFGGIGYHLISELSGEAGYTLTGGQYCYAGCTAGWTPGSKNITQGNYLQYEINTDGNWVALEVDIPHAGKYEAELTHLRAYSGTAGDLYLMPATGVGNIENGFIYQNLIGNINFRNQGGSETATTQLSDMYVPSAGKYYLVLKRNYVVNEYTYMLKLNMNGVKKQLSGVSLSLSDTEIDVGDTASASVTGVMNDNSAADLTGADITYTSSNPEIAAVDGNTGEITGISEGEAEITATVTLDGAIVSDTKTITVLVPAGLLGISITSSPIKTIYKTGEPLNLAGLVVSGTYSDGSTKTESVTLDNITGFDSSRDYPNQTVTVNIGGKTATFAVKIIRSLDCAQKTGSIEIDGYPNEADWNITHVIPQNTGDNSAMFGTLWDENYLYLYIDVVDDVLVNNSNKYYYDDCVEVYIDGDMVKGEYNEHCAQYTFRYGDTNKYVNPAGTASTSGVEHVSRETDTGYAMEIKIPWSNIGGLTVSPWETIGFTVHVNDKDTVNPAGKEEDIIFYTVDSPNEDWQESTNWAEMKLNSSAEEIPSAGELISYDFRYNAYPGDDSQNPRDAIYNDYTQNRRWAFVADNGFTGIKLKTAYWELVCWSLPAGDNPWVAVKIDVPAAGRYNAKLRYYQYGNGGKAGLYIVPYSPEAAANPKACITTENKKAEADTYTGGTEGITEKTLSEIVFENSGSYLVIIRVDGKNTSSGAYNILLEKLILDGSALEGVAFELSEEVIGTGERTAASNVTGILSSGSAADLSTAAITYTSSNPDAATVDKDTGIISAVSEGSTEITVNVTLGGVKQTASKTLLVDDDYKVDTVEIVGADTLALSTAGQLNLRGILRNGSTVAIPANNAVFEIVNQNPPGAVSLLGSGSIQGNAPGSATFRATVTYRGIVFTSNDFTVNVVEKIGADVVEEIVFTGTGGNARLLTNYSPIQKWVYYADNLTGSGTPLTQLTTCLQIVSQPNEWAALRINIPMAGSYEPTISYLGTNGGGLAALYIMPFNGQSVSQIEGSLTPTYYIDEYNGYNPTSTPMEKKLQEVYFNTPGEYLVVFKSVRKTAGWAAYMYPMSLLLEGTRSLKSAEVDFDADEIEVGQTAQALCTAYAVDGSVIDLDTEGVRVIYRTENPEVVSIDERGIITANALGEADISVTVVYNGIIVSDKKRFTVTDNSELLSIELSCEDTLWVGGTAKLIQKANMQSGAVLNVPADTMTYNISCTPEGVATIDETGLITAIMEGSVTISATSTFKGEPTQTNTITIPIRKSSKTYSTYWTKEKRENIKENAEKYSWAKQEVDSVVKAADKYVDSADTLWNLVVPEGLPRYYFPAFLNDPEKWYCRYCKVELSEKFGTYPWITNPLTNPWKIQCPVCKRRFPSNDFGAYYRSGLDEHGVFKPGLADRTLLTNTLYPEKDTELGVTGWGVDDGFGYFPGRTYENGVVERHSYISYYLHWGLWFKHGNNNAGAIRDAINNLSLAYVYTGEAKYGRAGAIILDRVADFYPDYDWYQWRDFRPDTYRGKILDPVWECGLAFDFAKAYDALFPIYDDAQVIKFLSEKAEKYNMENPKTSAALIRKNAEDNLLREIYKGAVDSKIAGNFGMAQKAVTMAAIALDTLPESREWIEWIMKPGVRYMTGANPPPCTGGNVMNTLIEIVDRDGNGSEAAAGYNGIWLNNLLETADLLNDYDKARDFNLYKNPKFAKMFTAQLPIFMADYYTAVIGDFAGPATMTVSLNKDTLLRGFLRLNIPSLAQAVYRLNDNSTAGLHAQIFDKNPEQVQKDIKDIIDRYGTLDIGSIMTTGYGFAVMRDGVKLESAGVGSSVNSLRDFSIYFGRNGAGHAHRDALNLGIDAYGLDFISDLGYPESTGAEPNQIQWIRATLSHNTVMVDGRQQAAMLSPHGTPLHFDDSGRVKITDIDATKAYPQTETYRRTLVMVEADDEVSYGVDFFRILGGNDHIYSFHAQSNTITDCGGLDLVPQVDEAGNYVGSYAGPDVEPGEDPNSVYGNWYDHYLKYPTGTTWLSKVRRAASPDKGFWVDFKVEDFRRKIIKSNTDLRLRMTMLTDDLTEVAIANGYIQKTYQDVVDAFEYVLARRTGTKLDSLYTAVYEPYKENRYIESITEVDCVATEGSPGTKDTAKAVKVVHKGENGESGRVDYIVYATNNTVKYRIDDLFDFRGVVGVYTVKDNGEELEPIYWYINDGDIIGENVGIKPEYTGFVEDFTRELQLENKIIVKSDTEMDIELLTDKYIYVDNSLESPENGAYRILGAKRVSENTYELDIGDVTLVRVLKDATDIYGGYIYNIDSKQRFRIPLTAVYDTTPVFKETKDKTVDAGSEIRFTVEAESPIGKPIKYKTKNPPRGSSFDPETRTFVWRPDKSQAGEYVVAIEASDGALSRTQYIKVKVLPSTMVPKPKDPGGTNGSGVGGGSGTLGDASGNGGGSSESGPDGDGSPGGIVIPPVTPDIGERFTDLAGFDWARDAINELAGKGVIAGKGGGRFAPGENITRADFVLLLTRAFNLTGEGEGFSDVPGGAYYENALKAAKANGIIMGIGDNKFNPKGEITREDMMVIVARALEKMGIALEDAPEDVLNEFGDSGDISDYAKSAVALLVKNGLIKGSAGKANPKGRATRAEIAVLIHRILTEFAE